MSKRILFCIAARKISINFFNCWNETLAVLSSKGYSIQYVAQYNPVICYTRNLLFQGSNQRGEYQLPFNGQLQSDDKVILLDDDIIWSPDDVLKLVESGEDIIAGCYPTINPDYYPIVVNLDDEYFLKHGNYQFLTRQDLDAYDGQIIDIDYTGMGFCCMTGKFLNSGDIKYPWFQVPLKTIGHVTDLEGEDKNFFVKAKEAGWKPKIHTGIRLGHEKTVILR